MKNCELCNKPLSKKGIAKGRTVHYICRCAQKFKKNGGNTSETRRKKAFKGFMKNPNIFRKLFS